jgi:FKBP-type peptidyl-prolyl cis-trans isomerase
MKEMIVITAILFVLLDCSNAFSGLNVPSIRFQRLSRTSMMSRDNFKKVLPVLLSGFLLSQDVIVPIPVQAADVEYVSPKYDMVAPWNSAIKYSIVKKGNGAQIKVGDLVEVRFLGNYKGIIFDDTFSTAEPYYFRAGVGTILKGLDDTIVQMKVGDRWKVNFSGTDLSFANGVKSSPGKPRIPAGGELDYEIEVVNLPGTGDDFIADFE